MVYDEPTQITYRVIEKEDISKVLRLAIDSELYVRGWVLYSVYHKALFLPDIYEHVGIVVAYDQDEPIGIVMGYKAIGEGPAYQARDVAFFVREEYRRKGIATEMLRLYTQRHGKYKLMASTGIDGSHDFFTKNQLTYLDTSQEKDTLHIFSHYRTLDDASRQIFPLAQ